MPKITVLMSVFNGGRYLVEAIESILHQTFSNFEFIIVNDGSTDKTSSILTSYSNKDSRIKILKNKKNIGLPGSLNRGIKEAQGALIARMDSDDISLPKRLEIQYNFLKSNPNISVCGGDTTKIKYPTSHENLKARLLFRTCFAHPTVMFTKKSFLKFNLCYDDKLNHSEDYDLWTRAISKVKFGSVGQPVLLYRNHPSQRSKETSMLRVTNKIRERFLKQSGFKTSSSEINLHNLISSNKFTPSEKFVREAEIWLDKLIEQNNHLHFVNESALLQIVDNHWFNVCSRSLSYRYFPFALSHGIINPLHMLVVAVKPALSYGKN